MTATWVVAGFGGKLKLKVEKGKMEGGPFHHEVTKDTEARRQKADFPSTNYSNAEECGFVGFRAIRGLKAW